MAAALVVVIYIALAWAAGIFGLPYLIKELNFVDTYRLADLATFFLLLPFACFVGLIHADRLLAKSQAPRFVHNLNLSIIKVGLAFVVFWIGYEALQLFLMLDWLSGARFAEYPIYPGLVPSLWEVPAWWRASGEAPSMFPRSHIALPLMPLLFVAGFFAAGGKRLAGRMTGPLRRHRRRKRFGKGGSAEFAGFLEDWANGRRPGGLLLGKSLYDRKQWVGLSDDRGFLTMATSRAGKGRSAIIPNLLTWRGSALVIDPKGTNAAVTAARRGFGSARVQEFMEQAVFVVDPFGIVKNHETSYFNPLGFVRLDDTVVEDIGLVADALIVPEGSSDSHWSEGAKMIVSGLIAHLLTCDPGFRPSLVDMRDALCMDADSFEAILDAMSRNEAAGGLPARTASLLRTAGPNERGSLMTTVLRNTGWIDSQAMRKILDVGESDFDLRELKQRHMTVYVVLPPELLDEHKRFMRLFVNLAVRSLSGGEKNIRVLFLLDEFYSLGNLSIMEKAAGLLAGYGLTLWPIIQNIGQLKQLYPQNWRTFLANTGGIQVFSVNDRETAQEIRDAIGRATQTVNIGGRLQRVVNELREAGELGEEFGRETGRQLILRSGGNPLALGRINYDRDFPKTWFDGDPDHPESFWFFEPEQHGYWKAGFRASVCFAAWAFWRLIFVRDMAADYWEFAQSQLLRQRDPVEWARLRHLKLKRAGAAGGGQRKSEREKESREKLIAPRRPEELSPPSPAPPPKPPAEPPKKERKPLPVHEYKGGALHELDQMIGLEAVKDQVRGVAAQIKRDRLRAQHGLPVPPTSRHLVFTGNPGTGKTTVAKIVGRIYKEMGLLKKGHMVEASRAGLVAPYVGQTAPLVDKVVESALDGILFIDEAYALAPPDSEKDFGYEAVTQLLSHMENKRDRLIVIVAGYKEEMDRFLNSNPGLRSRFKTFIDFPDYDESELLRIFEMHAEENGYRLDGAATEKVQAAIARMKSEAGKGFGNGRDVRNLLEDCTRGQAKRLEHADSVTTYDLVLITAEDVPGGA